MLSAVLGALLPIVVTICSALSLHGTTISTRSRRHLKSDGTALRRTDGSLRRHGYERTRNTVGLAI